MWKKDIQIVNSLPLLCPCSNYYYITKVSLLNLSLVCGKGKASKNFKKEKNLLLYQASNNNTW